MAGGDYTADAFVMYVDGVMIEEFTGVEGFVPPGETTLNAGPGGKAFGFNRQSSANSTEGTIFVRETSVSKEFLFDVARPPQQDVTIMLKQTRGLERVKPGTPIGFTGARCVLTLTDRQEGREGEAQDLAFQTLVIGYDDLKYEGSGE